jgi:uncharacterized protein (TIGR03067 family)
MRKTACLSVLLLALVGVGALAGDADDAKKLQGAWEVVELIQFGKKVDASAIKGTKFIFKDGTLSIEPANDKSDEFLKRTFAVKLHPAKSPAEVELKALDGEHKGTESPGIYELKGDTLRWCQSDSPKAAERPKEFASPEKSAIYLFTLKRVK